MNINNLQQTLPAYHCTEIAHPISSGITTYDTIKSSLKNKIYLEYLLICIKNIYVYISCTFYYKVYTKFIPAIVRWSTIMWTFVRPILFSILLCWRNAATDTRLFPIVPNTNMMLYDTIYHLKKRFQCNCILVK